MAFNGVIGSDEKVLENDDDEKVIDKKWNAWVLYLNWKASEKWTFTPRYELFSDKSKLAGFFIDEGATKPNDITALTLTSTFNIDDYSQLRFEVKRDMADEKLWTDAKGKKDDKFDTLSLSWMMKI